MSLFKRKAKIDHDEVIARSLLKDTLDLGDFGPDFSALTKLGLKNNEHLFDILQINLKANSILRILSLNVKDYGADPVKTEHVVRVLDSLRYNKTLTQLSLSQAGNNFEKMKTIYEMVSSVLATNTVLCEFRLEHSLSPTDRGKLADLLNNVENLLRRNRSPQQQFPANQSPPQQQYPSNPQLTQPIYPSSPDPRYQQLPYQPSPDPRTQYPNQPGYQYDPRYQQPADPRFQPQPYPNMSEQYQPDQPMYQPTSTPDPRSQSPADIQPPSNTNSGKKPLPTPKPNRNSNPPQPQAQQVVDLTLNARAQDARPAFNQTDTASTHEIQIPVAANNYPILECLRLAVSQILFQSSAFQQMIYGVESHIQRSQEVHSALAQNPNLTVDAIGSLVYYSADVRSSGGNESDSVYKMLNEALRNRDPSRLTPWRYFLYHMYEAKKYLPAYSGVVFRGQNRAISSLSKQYTSGSSVVWISFMSTTLSQDEAKKFGGLNSEGTWMIVTVNEGICMNFSMFPSEQEVLLFPNFKVRVDNILTDNMKRMAGLTLNLDVIELSQSK